MQFSAFSLSRCFSLSFFCLSLSPSVCLSLSLSVSPCVFVCPCLCLPMSVFMYMLYLCLSLYPSLPPSLSLSPSLCLCRSLSLTISVSISLYLSLQHPPINSRPKQDDTGDTYCPDNRQGAICFSLSCPLRCRQRLFRSALEPVPRPDLELNRQEELVGPFYLPLLTETLALWRNTIQQ